MTPPESDIWNCHPDLAVEWKQFTDVCQRSVVKGDLTADLWMNFWSPEHLRATNNDVEMVSVHDSPGPSGEGTIREENMSPEAEAQECLEEKMELEAENVALTNSQLQQISSISMELLDILDMASDNVPDELKEDIRSLPSPGMAVLLGELKAQLSDQGAYNFCTLLCEKVDGEPWINVALVFEIIFLPMLCCDTNKSIAEEVKAGLKQITEHFPAECASHLLKPLLTNELKSPSHLELLGGLTPLLPKKEFMYLLRYFVELCNAPIDEWRILVLNSLLSKVSPDILETKVESPLLNLLPVLSASARMLSASEPFASLLLKIIPALKSNTSARVHSELMTVVQHNNSFNKQALLNAVKSIGASS